MPITKLMLGAFLVLAAPLPCQAAPSPEEIIEHFFGPTPGPNRADAYTGEMKERYWEEPTIGQMLLPGKHYTARRLSLSPADAPVYAVAIGDGTAIIDWYAYFTRKDGILLLKAIRSLGRPLLTYESMVREQKSTRTAEEEWDDQSLRIALMPDIDRLAHFRRQLSELDALKAAIDAKDDAVTKARLHALHFSGWERNALGQLEIRLGGESPNHVIGALPGPAGVGVLYVPPGERPPPINEMDHIYIEQIEGPWYVYKT